MKLPHLAVSLLVAAALLPWLSVGQAAALAALCLLCILIVPKGYRPGFWIFPLCLLWVFWQGTPGSDDLSRLIPPQAQGLQLRFQVMGDTETFAFGNEEPESRLPVAVTAFYRRGEWQAVRGRVQFRMPTDQTPIFLTGTLWEATGVLRPGNFSYVGLYRSDCQFKPDPGALVRREGLGGNRFLQSLFGVRAALSRRLDAACPDDPASAATLQALLLGKRAELDRDQLQLFARTGLIHVFAISGLHLGLLAGMLILLGRRLGLSPRWMPVLVLPLLLCFTLYTGLRASALRALIMISCLLLAPVFQRKAHAPYAFFLAVILILALAPGQIYDLGFQYSFLLVAGLLAFAKFFGDRVDGVFAADPWMAPRPGAQWCARHVWPRLQGAVVVTALCFFISAPLTAFQFNLFSPVGLLGNLLAVPLVFLLLATGFPVLFTLWLPVSVTQILFVPARACAAGLLRWVELLDRVPGGVQWVQTPPLWMLLAFYGILALWAWCPDKQLWCLALLGGLAAYAGSTAWWDSRRPELGMIDADRGQAFWLRLPGEGVILLDAGSDWSGRTVADVLQKQGIDRIDTLILSHPDRHHVEGFRHLAERYPPGQIMVAASDRDHPLYAALEPAPRLLERGMMPQVAGWQLEVLHPPAQLQVGAPDTRSLVIRFTRGRQAVLWMGGAGASVTRRLERQGDALAATLLLAGHPREEDLWGPDFLQKVKPRAVLFSGQAFQGISEQRKAAAADAAQSGLGLIRAVPGEGLILNPENATF